MSSLNDIVINKTTGGLGRRQPNEDNISGLITTGIAVSGGVQLDTVYNLKSVADAEALKIDTAYDATSGNKMLLYHHITEFFRMNPNGELYLLVVAQEVTATDVLLSDLVDKTNANYAKKLLVEANGKIRQLGVCLNPDTGYTPTITTGLDADVLLAATNAEALYLEEAALHRPVHIILEGRSIDSTTIGTSLKDLREEALPHVSVVAGADKAISNADAQYNGYAAVGTVLGAVSKAKVNESIAWVEKFNLQSEGKLTAVGLSGNTALTSITDGSQDTLNTKGYIFFRTHTGIPGVYANDSHTYTATTDDFAYIENNRTIDKAIRLIRAKLLPKLGSPLKVDADTGQLEAQVVKNFEALGKAAIEVMVQNEEASEIDVYVNPEQNILATGNLEVKFDIVPTGTARKITVTIGFKNPFNA